ncbi:Z-ring formation inhibitor MciZ [Alteribacter natronophilus]|uniref:Z-ring formation inhibitor MciZ n=1 Tax=Alteribacter natronophilus TaxID=2583810 RepID=UPI00110F3720|nr:Z-ring formation inhibitor MciZ [Alteribacter natronophilus]TMW73687.1 Z-ring formation inhibitor MciZ [Alteribacter natronophilus]
MHVYLKDNGFIVAGKVWQVKAYLKQLSKEHDSVEDWIRKGQPLPATRTKGSASILPFPPR